MFGIRPRSESNYPGNQEENLGQTDPPPLTPCPSKAHETEVRAGNLSSTPGTEPHITLDSRLDHVLPCPSLLARPRNPLINVHHVSCKSRVCTADHKYIGRLYIR